MEDRTNELRKVQEEVRVLIYLILLGDRKVRALL